MDFLARIRAIAEELELVRDGTLVPLDSISLVQLLVRLETTFQCSIPSERVDVASFRSLEGIAGMMQSLVGGAA